MKRLYLKRITKMEHRMKGLDKLHNQENFDVQMEDNAKADVLEESGKCRRKNRKNRHHSPSAHSVADICSRQAKMMKFSSTMLLYHQLDKEPLELYNRLLPHILSAKQLQTYGFPLEYPNNPGKAVIKAGPRCVFLNNPNDRICSRCKEKYTVLEDGSYHSDTTCCYHSGKRQAFGDIYSAGAYSCCGNPGTSEGCIVRKQHVSAHGCLDKVKFVKTSETRQNTKNYIYALNCQMCYTIQGLEVTRVSIVGIDGSEVYDTFVLPENPIIDYNTTYSGITADHLKNVTTTLADVQAFLLELLTSSTILVGHGLANDLKALHLIHETIADASILFSSHQEKSRKPSLKTLASNYLKKTIRQGSFVRDSVEDARTSIELVLWMIQNKSQVSVPPPQTIPPVDTAPAKSVPEICSSQSKVVKYYPPLSLYLKLDLEPLELYNLLSLYVLHPEQLKRNGFPLESPNNPGKAVFKGGPRLSLLNNSNERICSRCNEKFTVLEDGSYHSETTCCYHSGKRQMLGKIYNAGAYSCCGDPGISNGCTVSTQHVSAHGCLDNVQFVKTRENRQNPKLHICALDCEMCYTIQGLEVTRVSIVGIDGLEVYDSFLIPENPIIDYNTTYSGITADHLKNVTTTLADVQAFLLELLTPSTILVGHGLENDLTALHLIHETIADTSIMFSSQEEKSRKPSLRTLASNYLEKIIQQGSCGHDSVEDARTCIELVLWKIQNDKSDLHVISANLYPHHHYSSYANAVLAVEPNENFPYLNFRSWVPPVGST